MMINDPSDHQKALMITVGSMTLGALLALINIDLLFSVLFVLFVGLLIYITIRAFMCWNN